MADPTDIKIDTCVHVNRTQKKVVYSIVAKDQTDQIKLVWADVEHRESEPNMEEYIKIYNI